MRCATHVARIEDMRYTYKSLVGKPEILERDGRTILEWIL
jgi:hypothetical protein